MGLRALVYVIGTSSERPFAETFTELKSPFDRGVTLIVPEKLPGGP